MGWHDLRCCGRQFTERGYPTHRSRVHGEYVDRALDRHDTESWRQTLIRFTPAQHAALARRARRDGISVNHLVRRLVTEALL